MENKKLGIAIIGAGAIAGVHIDAYKNYSQLCEVRAVCDIFVEKAQQLIDQYQLKNAVAVKDFHDILADEGIDAVSVHRGDDQRRAGSAVCGQNEHGHRGRRMGYGNFAAFVGCDVPDLSGEAGQGSFVYQIRTAL